MKQLSFLKNSLTINNEVSKEKGLKTLVIHFMGFLTIVINRPLRPCYKFDAGLLTFSSLLSAYVLVPTRLTNNSMAETIILICNYFRFVL